MINHCQVHVVGCDSAVTQLSPSAPQNFAGVKVGIRSTTSKARLGIQHKRSVNSSSKEGKPVAGPRRQQLIQKPQYRSCTWTPSVLHYSRAEAHKSTGPELAPATLQAKHCQLRWKKAVGCSSRTDTHMGNLHTCAHTPTQFLLACAAMPVASRWSIQQPSRLQG